MKNIEPLKRKYLNIFSNKYYNKSPLELDGDLLFKCSILSEIWAYIISILPSDERDDIFRYTIFDFDGCINSKKERKQVIPIDVAINAKNIICKYCWGKTWNDIREHFKDDEKKIKEFLRNHSVMAKRIDEGSNLVIFGESDIPIGKTMLASIVMKEAIKLRVNNNKRGQTYDWVDFSKLKYEIIKDTINAVEYRSCSWLVIDNINRLEHSSIQQKAYISDILNSFFIDRLNNKLPTILSFKFDIRKKSFNIEKEMGIGISKIVKHNKTYIVPLCEEYEV